MNDPAESLETTEFVMAHYHALRLVVGVLLDSHPDPATLLPHLDRCAEQIRAVMLNTRLPEAALALFDKELAILRKRLELRKAEIEKRIDTRGSP